MLQFISAYSNCVVCVKIRCLNLKMYMLNMADLSQFCCKTVLADIYTVFSAVAV